LKAVPVGALGSSSDAAATTGGLGVWKSDVLPVVVWWDKSL